MRVYADTNFLAQLYLPTSESDKVQSVLDGARAAGLAQLPMTWLLYVETINTFEQYVFISRTLGTHRVTPEQASIAQHAFKQHVQAAEFLVGSDLPAGDIAQRCEELSRRHTARYGARIYDLVHVASALLLNCEHFWSFDQRVRKLARLEGLKTNPVS
jgi:predicted nucleic acid-binding protein